MKHWNPVAHLTILSWRLSSQQAAMPRLNRCSAIAASSSFPGGVQRRQHHKARNRLRDAARALRQTGSALLATIERSRAKQCRVPEYNVFATEL